MEELFNRESLLDIFVFETLQGIEEMEQCILDSERSGELTSNMIGEIFRIMHTIKGSADMMSYTGIAQLTHTLEDLFFYIRENQTERIQYHLITDLVFQGIDFVKGEMSKIQQRLSADGDAAPLQQEVRSYLDRLKNPATADVVDVVDVVGAVDSVAAAVDMPISTCDKARYCAEMMFSENCGMENVRAYTVIYQMNDIAEKVEHDYPNLLEGESLVTTLREEGFSVRFSTDVPTEELQEFFTQLGFIREFSLTLVDPPNESPTADAMIDIDTDTALPDIAVAAIPSANIPQTDPKQRLISVGVTKLDKLMDLVGELVISEAMVTRNPELQGLAMENFTKSAVQLRKITNELQDMVMSIRMVPLKGTFQKMNRLVRDMCQKLGKQVNFVMHGEDTEVDKNIIEHLSDPLLHLIRNAIDHGTEPAGDRIAKGKTPEGNLWLEAKNEGGDVWIIVRDDGKGLNREKILAKADASGLLTKPEQEMSDKEVFALILHPGLSTNATVTEFSGRGVGMDVVSKNMDKVGGSVLIESTPDVGTSISLKIPLTLAIIDGMCIRVGSALYIVPITSIREAFKAVDLNVIKDLDENETIMVRGEGYPIIRLHRTFGIPDAVNQLKEGILLMVDSSVGCLCLFADELIGEQQIVVKTLPMYLKKVKGISGCTLLGDGSIGLILDIGALVDN